MAFTCSAWRRVCDTTATRLPSSARVSSYHHVLLSCITRAGNIPPPAYVEDGPQIWRDAASLPNTLQVFRHEPVTAADHIFTTLLASVALVPSLRPCYLLTR